MEQTHETGRKSFNGLARQYSAPVVGRIFGSCCGPAGISGSALAGAIGAALMVKVARITERKLPPGPERDKVVELGEKIERLRNVLEDVVDEDAEAYAKLVRIKSAHARGLESDQALERALKTSTIIPGAMGRAAMICINLAAELAEVAYRRALWDLAMGVWLCNAAVEASLTAAAYNLSEISDDAFRAKLLGKLDFFDNRSSTLDAILSTTRKRGVPTANSVATP